MKFFQVLFPITALVMCLVFRSSFVFLFFSLVSLLSSVLIMVLYVLLSKMSGRIKRVLEYLASLSLILCCAGVFIDNTLVSIFYAPLGAAILVRSLKEGVFYEDFLVVFLSLLGFWVIFYEFMSLGGVVPFLLAVNAALLIGWLSYAMLEEFEKEVFEGTKVRIKVNFVLAIKREDLFRRVVPAAVISLIVSYVIAWLLKSKLWVFCIVDIFFILVPAIFILLMISFLVLRRIT